MDEPHAQEPIEALIAEYMERGFLENIVDMFRHDPSLFNHVALLIADERSRVRIGIIALMEDMAHTHGDRIAPTLPLLRANLGHVSPLVRGDTLYLISILGDRGAIPSIEPLLGDENAQVRLLAAETLAELEGLG